MARESELEYLIRIIISCEVVAVFDALVKVSQICSSYPASVRKFNSLGGTSVLLELLENPKYSKCTGICMSILANCCMDDTVREQVIKRRDIPIFVRILSCTKSESTTRRRACRGLANIAVSNQGATEVLLCKAIEPIVSFLSSSSTFDCRETALRAVRILAKNPECRGDLISYKAPAVTANLLSNKDVREPAVRALASLTRDCSPQCALQIRDARAFKPLQAILQRSGGAVWEATFSTVVNLSAVAEARPHLGDVQVVPTLISCLNAYNLREPSKSALPL